MVAAQVVDPAGLEAQSRAFESASPQEIVSWAVHTFSDGLSVGASFGGASGMAILHMAAQLKPNVHVFVLDTDYLFEETHEQSNKNERHNKKWGFVKTCGWILRSTRLEAAPGLAFGRWDWVGNLA